MNKYALFVFACANLANLLLAHATLRLTPFERPSDISCQIALKSVCATGRRIESYRRLQGGATATGSEKPTKKPDTIRRRPKDKNGLFLTGKKMMFTGSLGPKSAWGEMMRRLGEGEGMNPASIWASRLALLFIVAGSVWWIGLNNATPLVFWTWAYLLAPVAFAAMPQLRQTRGTLWAATGLLALYCFLLASLLTAVFFVGMVMMVFASIASFLPSPPDETFRRKVIKRRALDDGCEETTLECGHMLIADGGVFEDSMYCAKCLHEFIGARRRGRI